MVKNEFYTLYNGVTIPKIGFGTWQVAEGEEAYNSVTYALKVGYRHIDTAHAYGNEASVGRAIADSGIDRKDIFVTTKLPSHIKDYQGTMQHFNQSLTSLGLEYIDLYLGAEARKGLVDGVVDYFIYQMVKTPYRGSADIHSGAFSYRFQTLKDLYLAFVVMTLILF